MKAILNILLLLSMWSATSVYAISFKIYWKASGNVSGIQNRPLEAFIQVNGQPVNFSTVESSIVRDENNKAISSQSIGAFANKDLGENNRIKFEFFTIDGTRIVRAEGSLSVEVSVDIRGYEKTICRIQTLPGSTGGDCVADLYISLEEINPDLYVQFKKIESEVKNLSNDAKSLALNFEHDISAINGAINIVNTTAFIDLNENDFSFLKEALDTFRNLKKTISDLKSDIYVAQQTIKEVVQGIKDRVFNILGGENIDLKDPNLYNFSLPLTAIAVEIPQIPSVQDPFEEGDNRYEAAAIEVISALEQAWSRGDRSEFLDITLSWIANNEAYLPLLRQRAVVSHKEWAAYQRSVAVVRGAIFGDATRPGYMDQDLWFKDSQVPQDVRRIVDRDIREKSPENSKKLGFALRKWKGQALTPEQVRILESVKLLGMAFQAMGTRVAEDVKKLDYLVSDFVRMIAEGSACAIRIGITGDGGDFYEFATGRDQCTGEELSLIGRAISGAAVIIGNGKVLRGIAEVIGVETKVARAAKAAEEIIDSAKNYGAATSETMQDFAKWLKKPLANNPERGAIGNSVDKTLEIIKDLRPEQAALEGARLFEDVPKSLRSNVWDIMENLPQALKDNPQAKGFINTLRPHELTANLRGWTSLDLVPNNPSASPLRFLFKTEADGTIKWMIKDTH